MNTSTTALVVVPSISPALLVSAREEIEKVSGPVIAESETAVAYAIAGVEQYRALDAFLSRVQFARGIIAEILSVPIIQPVYQALESLYAMRRGLDGPLEKAETQAKRRMADWQVREDARVKQEQAERDKVEAEDRARIKMELAAAEKKRLDYLEEQALASTNPQETAQFFQKAEDILTAPAPVISFASPPIAGLTRAANSSAKSKPKWKVVDIDLIVEGVYAGAIPKDVLVIDSVAVNKHFKLDQKGVAEWPGVEVYTDVEISGR